MQLILSVGDKVLDKVTINAGRTKEGDYLQAQKRLLLFKHQLSILALNGQPVFYLIAGSKMK
ncbi:MAG: hypothetical protein EOO53_20800 [Gammaproteobacteria bacterium]|nr:MAG: hypothetical protein EOO53_20800 [Gammaproteobacteria bacterium]